MTTTKNYLLTLVKSSLVLMIACIVFVSCSKSKDDAPPTVEGQWIGKYGFGNDARIYDFTFNFKPGGVLERIDGNGQVVSTGTWEMNNNIIEATYIHNNVQFSLLGGFYPEEMLILGDWGYNNAVDEGTFELSKN